MYVVTGATGNIGAELVRALAEDGQRVRAVVRDPARASLPDGVEAVTGDLNRPETLAEALDGAQGMYLMPGYEHLDELLVLAGKAGLARVVLLSGGSAALADLGNAVSRYMALSEQTVRESGLAWTFLRPRSFMSNALRWLPQLAAGDMVRAQFSGVRVAAVDPADIAAVAARALTGGDLDGRILDLTGPAALLPAEQVEILAEVLDRPLVCRELTDDETRAELAATMPRAYAEAFTSFFIDGTLDESEVHPTVREVTGREPRTFRQWAQAHADAFRTESA